MHQTEGGAHEVFEHNPCLRQETDWTQFRADCFMLFHETRLCQPLSTLATLIKLKWDGREDLSKFMSRIHELIHESFQALEATNNITMPRPFTDLLGGVVLYANLPESHKDKFSGTFKGQDLNMDFAFARVKAKCGEVKSEREKRMPLSNEGARTQNTVQAYRPPGPGRASAPRAGPWRPQGKPERNEPTPQCYNCKDWEHYRGTAHCSIV